MANHEPCHIGIEREPWFSYGVAEIDRVDIRQRTCVSVELDAVRTGLPTGADEFGSEDRLDLVMLLLELVARSSYLTGVLSAISDVDGDVVDVEECPTGVRNVLTNPRRRVNTVEPEQLGLRLAPVPRSDGRKVPGRAPMQIAPDPPREASHRRLLPPATTSTFRPRPPPPLFGYHRRLPPTTTAASRPAASPLPRRTLEPRRAHELLHAARAHAYALDDGSSMPRHQQQLEDEDRLSTLPDDILLSILGRVSLRIAARTCVLSTRWRHLPWLLPEVNIDVKDFLSVPRTEPIEAKEMEELAMVSLTKATWSFLADQQRKCTITSLHLKLYLTNTSLCRIGPQVGEAINNALLKELDLTVLDETDPLDCSDEDMLQRAQEIDTFFRAYPSVLHCLTKLSMKNAGFDKLDMHHVLFDCCKQLKDLSLCYCDTGTYSVFRIDAPDSKLCVLDIDMCRFERIELVCLPKLETFICTNWVSHHVPVTFGFVPSLGELELSCGKLYDRFPFKLSELLHGTTSIHSLTLDFEGENLWLQPEMEELCTAFSKLKKLSVCGVFVEFEILWIMAFLVAAPSIEKLHIQVWNHACDVGEFRGDVYRDRSTPQWEMRFNGSENRLLKVLEIDGFRALEQQFAFIRSMLECSPNLRKIILRGDDQCDDCRPLDASLRHPSKFPEKDEEEMVVERIIRDGLFSPEIIFAEDWSLSS
ncbi:hypothetical protein QYE76_060273 [Lolium multiflorum]|uniref:At1g61320/AtMIF1 LRR domain-containing protein n=1 Tax=Lolium multiflorum TaxID=4521 RepID=A0AAD8W438_LOLMU|nr:hypothetical protein QYE76_060273 [Lolium multiflorum]